MSLFTPCYVCFICNTLLPLDENIGMLSNTTYNGWKDKIQLGGITNKALLEGDLKALESFLYSNQTQVLLLVYLHSVH